MQPVRSIVNQYRGVNAHLHSRLQSEGGWDSFHTLHIGHLTVALQAQLDPMGYEADLEQSLQIRRTGETPRTPESDIAIYDPDPICAYLPVSAHPGGAQDIVMPIPTLLDLSQVEIEYYNAIGIHQSVNDGSERGKLVGWIELLSPTNKPTGRHFETYRQKRTDVLRDGIVFVEIDYLHQFPPTFTRLANYRPQDKKRLPEPGSSPYRIAVIDPRPEFWDGQGHVQQFNVDDPLPTMTIPLSGEDVLDFDFGAPYKRTFQEMLYGKKVDYTQLPVNFDLYSPDDQARIMSRMLAVLKLTQVGADLEQPPQPVEVTPLEDGLKQLEAVLKVSR